jgi:hypothetical protein
LIGGAGSAGLWLEPSTGLKVIILIFLRIFFWPVPRYRGERFLSAVARGRVCSVSERKKDEH